MTELTPYLRFIACTSNLPNKRHTVAYDCRFLYVLSGSGKMITDEGSFDLCADTLLYYPCGIRYFLKSDGKDAMKFYTVNFDFTNTYDQKGIMPPVYYEDCDFGLVQPSHKDLGEERYLSPFVIENAAQLRPYFARLDAIYHNEKECAERLTSSLLSVIILEILYRKSSSAPSNKIIDEATAFIKEHYSEHLTNGAIAAALKYHPYYLGALFRKHLGKTTRDYLDEVRLEKAKDRLSLTDDSIYKISAECGFKTAEHFTKRFKMRYGETPTAWRRRQLWI